MEQNQASIQIESSDPPDQGSIEVTSEQPPPVKKMLTLPRLDSLIAASKFLEKGPAAMQSFQSFQSFKKAFPFGKEGDHNYTPSQKLRQDRRNFGSYYGYGQTKDAQSSNLLKKPSITEINASSISVSDSNDEDRPMRTVQRRQGMNEASRRFRARRKEEFVKRGMMVQYLSSEVQRLRKAVASKGKMAKDETSSSQAVADLKTIIGHLQQTVERLEMKLERCEEELKSKEKIIEDLEKLNQQLKVDHTTPKRKTARKSLKK